MRNSVVLASHSVVAQEILQPGNATILEIPIENEAPSTNTAHGVQLSATIENVQPASLDGKIRIDEAGSDLGPATIEVGPSNAKLFRVRVVADSDAIDGTFDVKLRPTFQQEPYLISPDPEVLDTTVKFLIASSPTVRAVFTSSPLPDGTQPPNISTSVTGIFPPEDFPFAPPFDATHLSAEIYPRAAALVSLTAKENGVELQGVCGPIDIVPVLCDLDLEDGATYEFRAENSLGLVSSTRFRADGEPPEVDIKVRADPQLSEGVYSGITLHKISVLAGDGGGLRDVKLAPTASINFATLSSTTWASVPTLNPIPFAEGQTALPLETFDFPLDFTNLPNGDYTVLAIDHTGKIGPPASVVMFDDARTVPVLLPGKKAADCRRGVEYKDGAWRLGTDTVEDGVMKGTVSVSFMSPRHAGSVTSAWLNSISAVIAPGPGLPSEVLGATGPDLVFGLNRLVFSANAKPPLDPLFSTEGQQTDETIGPVGPGSLVRGQQTRFYARFEHVMSGGSIPPGIVSLDANLTDHVVKVLQSGKPEVQDGRFAIPVGQDVVVNAQSHQAVEVTLKIDQVDAPGEVSVVDLELNDGQGCREQPGPAAPKGTGLLDIVLTAPGYRDFDVSLPLSQAACSGANEPRLHHVGEGGEENLTESVDRVNCRITGKARSSSPFFIFASSGPGSAIPGTGVMPGYSVFDGAGLAIVGPAMPLPFLAVDDGTTAPLTEYRLPGQAYRSLEEPLGGGTSVRAIEVRSSDGDGNLEVAKSTQVHVDADAPNATIASLPVYTNNPTPSFRAVFTDALAGVDAASLSLSVPGSTLTTSVVSDATFTWRSGTALPLPMYTHTMLYWKENLYIVGGIDNTALRAQVHRTPLTDGAPLSDWEPTAGLTTPSGVMGAAAAADHLFVMGSFAPGSLKVWQTLVNANGTLDEWRAGPDLPIQLSSLQGVAVGAAGGYLYAIGGQSSDNAPRNQVYVNTLTPQGTLGDAWTGVTPLREAMTDSAAAAYGGRIYTVSGRGVGGAASNFVRSAGVMSDGNLDGWRVETDLPAGRYWGRALAAGGRLYFLGGRDDSSPRSEVWSAPILEGGFLGAWKEEPPLHAPLMLLGAAASPDVLFYSGGANNSGVSAELRYGRLVPEGGFLATATVTAVPAAPLQDGAYTLAASGGDRVSNTGSGSIQFTVDTQPPTLAVSANGLPLVDGETRTLNAAVLEFVAAYSDTSSGVNPSSVSLRLDGADVGAADAAEIRFSPAALAPGEHHLEARASDFAGNAAVVSVRFIYDPTPPAVSFLAPSSGAVYGSGPVGFHAVLEDALSGMATGSIVVTVDGATVAANVAATNSGEALAWREGTDLPEPMYTHTMLYWNGYLYIVGGIDNTAFRTQVHRSSLTDGEPLSGWSETSGLQTPSGVMGAAAAAGRLFVMGSFSPGSLSVWQSVVGAQGALGTWTQGPNLPMPLSSLQGVAVGAAGGYLYAIGGQSGDNVARKEVYVNKLGSDGSLGPGWNEVAPLMEEMTDSAAAAYGGRIYTVSGRGLNGAASRFVRSAKVMEGGQLDGWRVETDLPAGRYWGRALAAGGRLYFLGGRDDSSPRGEVWSAPILQDGSLGAWDEEDALHAPLMLFGAAASPDVLFYSGGVNNSGASAELRFGRVPGSNASVTATGTVAGLPEGPREFRVSGSDLAGNTAFASVTVHIDLSPPQTSLVVQGTSSTAPGLVLAQAGATVTLTAVDQPASPNAGVAATYLSINDGPFMPAPAVLALSTGTSLLQFWSIDTLGLSESTQTVLVTLQDAPSVAVAADGNAGISAEQPVTITTVSVANAPSIYELARDAQGLDSVFPVYYELDGGTFPAGEPALLSFYIDLTVIPDTTTLRIFTFDEGTASWDSAPILNQQFTLLAENYGVFTGELLHTSAYALMRRSVITDPVAPAVAFAFPRPDEPGLCRLAQGPVTVRGSVTDEEISSWSVTQGSVLVGSGTANAEGTLGLWDATGLSGAFGLALSALDASGNTASASLSVQAGDPARVLALGGKQVLNKPRGVAAGPDRLYVADTNADRVRVFDAAGVALAVMGDKKGAAKLNKPAGLALDAAGNILVADANNKRVVKLSPAGVFLVEYGKGLLKRPMAVALSLGRIVVADAKAGQLIVFSDAGALLAQVELPSAPPGPDEDPEEPRPVALAADAAGGVWAADAKGGRVLRFTPDLALAQTIPGFERPEGVAVTPSGACLAVSEAKSARIRTFDAQLSAGLAAFGVHGEVKENKPLPPEFLLNKPAQLAFTAAGTLLVADRNNDLVQGFGLPGTPAEVAMGTPGRSGGSSRLASADGGEGEVVASGRVGRFEGGRIEHPDGAAVEIPAGAVTEDVDVAVAAAPDDGDEHRVREAGRSLAGLAAASAAREFSPHGLTFREPALITLPYDPLLAAAARALKIHYWNPERSAWEALDSEVDEGARTVSARVAHFSVYQVLAPAGAVSVLADPDSGFAFRAIYAFPNPAVGGQKPTVHVAVGRADKVTIRFYDVAGTPVHEATLETPSVVNDESGPHWAYEYAWNGHIPSGVYIYSVTAEKAGHAPIKRVGKLAVVR